MPASSIDTFLACSVMIVLVLSAIVGASKVVTPYLYNLSHENDLERFEQLASLILLSTGTPSNWGQMMGTTPMTLGLAKTNSTTPYELDIDKISRLSPTSIDPVTYAQLWKALGIEDVSFQIEFKTLFELSMNPISNSTIGSQTAYNFEVMAQKSGEPVSADLSAYAVVKDFATRISCTTSSDGVGSFQISLPNQLNGTALLIVLARARVNPQIVSYKVYAFSHNSSTHAPNENFTKLSPINHTLSVLLANSTVQVLKAQLFTFNYNFSLTQNDHEIQTIEYPIPRLLDPGPMILVVTGHSGSTFFAEWTSYPCLPLIMGANFDQSIAGAKIVSISRIVTINSALYEVTTRWGGTT
jgi:hypothetical protein